MPVLMDLPVFKVGVSERPKPRCSVCQGSKLLGQGLPINPSLFPDPAVPLQVLQKWCMAASPGCESTATQATAQAAVKQRLCQHLSLSHSRAFLRVLIASTTTAELLGDWCWHTITFNQAGLSGSIASAQASCLRLRC